MLLGKVRGGKDGGGVCPGESPDFGRAIEKDGFEVAGGDFGVYGEVESVKVWTVADIVEVARGVTRR